MALPLGVTLYEQMLTQQAQQMAQARADAAQKAQLQREDEQFALENARHLGEREDARFDKEAKLAELYGQLAGYEKQPAPRLKNPRLQEIADLHARAGEPGYRRFSAQMSKDPWGADKLMSREAIEGAKIGSREGIEARKLESVDQYRNSMANIAFWRLKLAEKLGNSSIALNSSRGMYLRGLKDKLDKQYRQRISEYLLRLSKMEQAPALTEVQASMGQAAGDAGVQKRIKDASRFGKAAIVIESGGGDPDAILESLGITAEDLEAMATMDDETGLE